MITELPMKIGDIAPIFTVKDQFDKEIKLEDYKGKKVLLSFHPLAWTSVCAEQMKSLEKHYDDFKELNTIPFGVSIDHTFTKKEWSNSLEIENLSMLCDFWPHGKVANEYKCFIEKLGFSGRNNILIDEAGKIALYKIYELKTVPDFDEIIEFIKQM